MPRQNSQLCSMIGQTLEQLAVDPFHATLKTRRLSGEVAVIWACSIDYSYCILFEWVANPEASEEDAVLLLNLGDHDDGY